MEPWITPSLFEQGGPDAVDEWCLSDALGDSAHSTLSQHWNSFITADDFQQISAAGMNHVRIPVGYWAVVPQEGEPFVQGQLDVLDQAIGWARDAGLKVIVDLHGGKFRAMIIWLKNDKLSFCSTWIAKRLRQQWTSRLDQLG